MDNFLLQAVVDEIRPQLVGTRVGRVFQPSAWDLIVESRTPGGSLFIRTSPGHLALFLGHRKPDDESKYHQLPPFATQLRKALASARVSYIEKLGDDRVIDIGFGKIGENRELRLAISLAGRSADIQLVDGNRIVASLRGREVGSKYILPAPIADRLDPIDLPEETWLEVIERAGGDIAIAATRLIGFTPLYGAELSHLSNSIGPVNALRKLMAKLGERPSQAAIYASVPIDTLRRDPGLGSKLILASIDLEHLATFTRTRFPSLSAAAEVHYQTLDEQSAFLDRRRKIDSALRAQLKRQVNLREKLNDELAKCQNADRDQRLGEILLANLHDFTKSGLSFVVKDYFESAEPWITIADQETSDPRVAAEQYFKRARRARRGSIEISKRLAVVEEQIARLDSQIRKLASATSIETLSAFAPLTENASFRATPKRLREKKGEPVSGVRRYKSSDGLEILVGRTDRDNDNLTMRVARSSDLWFHAADYPGSHVVLRNPQKRAVPPTSIREAAELAAKFSQAKNSAKVAVNYCEKKFVTKPKGLAPGQVRLSSFKTILVEPKESGERILSTDS